MDSNDLLTGIIAVTFTLLFFIAIIVVVILAARRQTILRRLDESEYRGKMNEVSLAALRAQMNPHFIFNCLNSIKLYTEQNNNIQAISYLDKFSRLMRNILDETRTDTIPLLKEVETLQLYLDMEKMRFKDMLDYQIVVDESIEVDYIEIPSMLIQPYIENAILHGIMHKARPGRVILNISQDNIENALLITIKDDGVGRAMAEKLKANKKSNHKSHGTQITADRIALLNARNETYLTTVTTTDLLANDGQSLGTLVTLKLSMKCQNLKSS